jgi:hypothetical protein
MTHHGSCHCARVRFDVDGTLAQAMECNCSHCSRKGYLLWFVPRAQFHLQTPENALAAYTFNKHHIRHQFCTTCGCAPFAFGQDRSGAPTVAVNVRCLENVDLGAIQRVAVDGRSF